MKIVLLENNGLGRIGSEVETDEFTAAYLVHNEKAKYVSGEHSGVDTPPVQNTERTEEPTDA